jgi:methionyl-tRNA formyltransferase
MFERIAIAGDDAGIAGMLAHVPATRVACLIAASRRPQHLPAITRLAAAIDKPVLVQPPTSQPADAQFEQALARTGADSLVCHSYSMLFPPTVLSLVKYQAVNVHAALLPRNRGPNPLQWAIIRGEDRTGVTLHVMSDGFDEGDIVAQEQVPILPQDTWRTLAERVEKATLVLLQREMPAILKGNFRRKPQDPSLATRNPRLNADSPRIEFDRMTDWEIYNLIRSQVAPLPGAYLDSDGRRIRFAEMLSLEEVSRLRRQHHAQGMTP